MKKRHPNHRLAKKGRSYTVEDAADLLGTHKNTVRNWLKKGLATINDIRPKLIRGEVLSAFLLAKRTKNKQPCKPGEIYCVKCRAPKVPDGNMADYQPQTATLGNLIAICPDCYKIINRRINLTKLDQVRGKLDITMPQAQERIVESNQPSVNCDLR